MYLTKLLFVVTLLLEEYANGTQDLLLDADPGGADGRDVRRTLRHGMRNVPERRATSAGHDLGHGGSGQDLVRENDSGLDHGGSVHR